MVSRDSQNLIIWPTYFDKSLSRLEGRRIPKNFAIDKPDIDKILKAIKSLGISFEVEKDSSHPSRSWRKEGRIIIKNQKNKNKLLLRIAKIL